MNARHWLSARDTRLARAWHARRIEAQQADATEEAWRFVHAFETQPGPGRLVLARARKPDGLPYWAGLPIEDFVKERTWILGSSGSGKSFLALAIILLVLLYGRFALILFDFKNELAQLVQEVLLPALSQRRGGDRLLRHLRIVNPFSEFVPLLRLTHPEPGVAREVQAYTVASAMEDALGDDLGQRMHRVLLRFATLAIEFDLPLTVIRRWLEDPESYIRVALRSADPDVRRSATTFLARENRASLDALLSRADAFLFLPATQRALATPGCVSFPDALEQGVTILPLGDPPAGAEQLTRFWGGILVGKFMRAVLSRPIRPDTRPALTAFDEFQECGRHQSEQFGRLLALARSKRCGLCFINQQVAQLDSTLVRLLRTNVSIEAAFRCNIEDAKAYAHAVPVSQNTKRPGEARQALVEQLTRLERRQYLLWIKGQYHAQLVCSPRLALERLRALSERSPQAVRDFIRQGTVALRTEDIDARLSTERPEPDPEAYAEEVLQISEGHEDDRFPRLG